MANACRRRAIWPAASWRSWRRRRGDRGVRRRRRRRRAAVELADTIVEAPAGLKHLLLIISLHICCVRTCGVPAPVPARIDAARAATTANLGDTSPNQGGEVADHTGTRRTARPSAAIDLIIPGLRCSFPARVTHCQILPSRPSWRRPIVAVRVGQTCEAVHPLLCRRSRRGRPCDGVRSMHAAEDVVRFQPNLRLRRWPGDTSSTDRHVTGVALQARRLCLADRAMIHTLVRSGTEQPTCPFTTGLAMGPAHVVQKA